MIQLSCPQIGEEEFSAVERVLKSGMLAQGPEVDAFEAEFSSVIGSQHAIAVNSGTSALLISLLASDIGPGDEVIVPSFTFAATANAVALTGATPIFVDVDPNTFCMSPDAALAAVGPRTAAIMPVHLYGHPADMDGLSEVALSNGLLLFEDAAQAHLAAWGGKKVGTFGTASFSFYPTKNMMSGEGGMITTSDPEVARKSRLLRNQGMERRYQNEIAGFNCRMTDLHAAIGREQLKKLPAWTSRRQQIAGHYNAEIRSVLIPKISSKAVHVFHQYTVQVVDGRQEEFSSFLTSNGVGNGVYYPTPVHRLPSFNLELHLEVTEKVARNVVSIPVNPLLSDEDVETVVEVVNQWS